MNRPPAFQFYVKDWLTSRAILLMTPELEGAYIRLLAYCWDSDNCSLPNDNIELAKLSRLGEHWSSEPAAVLRNCFVPHPDKSGYLTNLRLLKEFKKCAIWREKARNGGIRSGQVRKERLNHSSGVLELSGNISSSSFSSSSFSSSPSDIEQKEGSKDAITLKEIVDTWNAIAGVKPCRTVSGTFKTRLEVLARQNPPNWWQSFFEEVKRSKFLRGESIKTGKTPFVASLYWATQEAPMTKIMAGEYADGDGVKRLPRTPV